VKRNYHRVWEEASPGFKDGRTPDVMQRNWEAFSAQTGALKRQLSASRTIVDGREVVAVACDLEKATAVVRVTFNPEGKLYMLQYGNIKPHEGR
jgi:hypothetical protein